MMADQLVSKCCGAPDGVSYLQGWLWSEHNICPKCKKWCDFLTLAEFQQTQKGENDEKTD